MGEIVCGMQKHEFTVNQLLCTNSHGCCWWGLCIPTSLAEVGPLRAEQERQTLKRTGKRNAHSRGMHFHSPLVLPGCLLHLSELSEWRLPACMGLTANPQLSPLGWDWGCCTGIPVSHWWSCNRGHAACGVSGRGFGVWVKMQLIQICFDKVRCVCCESPYKLQWQSS